MDRSESIIELAKALSKMQSQLQSVPKTKINPFFKSTYADLDCIWETVRKPLTDNGLSVIQTTFDQSDKVILETTLLHGSGEWVRSYLPINAKANDPQAIGSAITYARRYSLSAILGVSADEDDDGEQAMNRNGKPQVKQQPANTPVASQQPQQAEKTFKETNISTGQIARLMALAGEKNISDEQIKAYIKKHWNLGSKKELNQEQYDQLCSMIEKATKKEC